MYYDGWFDPAGTGGGGGTPPTITLISPPTFATLSTPVVIDVLDDTGLSSVYITASGAGLTGTVAVYVAGAFQPGFTASTVASVSGGYRFTITKDGGWSEGELDLFVAAVDTSGNSASAGFSWVIDTAPDDTTPGPGVPFRDSVWRWRRRLDRQKCSVISVAIDDNYTAGPGFVLNALALEIGRKPGLDRVPWRSASETSPSGSGSESDGT